MSDDKPMWTVEQATHREAEVRRALADMVILKCRQKGYPMTEREWDVLNAWGDCKHVDHEEHMSVMLRIIKSPQFKGDTE